MTSRKLNQRRTLSFQRLEDRVLMAGDVSVAVKNGALVIKGDNQANEILITQVGAGQYQVSSYLGSDTTVNGQTTAQTFSGVTKDFNIDLKGGSDELVLLGDTNAKLTVPGNLHAKFAGNSTIEIEDAAILGNISVKYGAGNFGLIASTVAGGVSVKGRAGGVEIINDEIGSPTFNSGNDDLNVNFGAGDSSFEIRNTHVERDMLLKANGSSSLHLIYATVKRDLTAKLTGNSSSTESVILKFGEVGRNTLLQTGAGNDNISIIGQITGQQLKVLSGAGNDTVALGGYSQEFDSAPPQAAVADQVFVDLGSGDDTLQVGGNVLLPGATAGGMIANQATYLGGTGVDKVLNESGGDLFGSFSGFESMPFKAVTGLGVTATGLVTAR